MVNLFDNNGKNQMNERMSRREFLTFIAAGIAGLLIEEVTNKRENDSNNILSQDHLVFLPLVQQGNAGNGNFGPRVIHTYSPNVTSWNGSPAQYWDYVDQNVVNDMVNLGVKLLTSEANTNMAWEALLPNYKLGQKIAIKVSFNNTRSCITTEYEIDAIIEPVNAIIAGLTGIGVSQEDIWIFDASRTIPNRFKNGCLFSDVKFLDDPDRGCGLPASFSGNDPTSQLELNPPPGYPPTPLINLTDVICQANYLINIPIMKHHAGAGVSLAFKNHFGSIDSPSDLHGFIGQLATEDYSALVDLYLNPNIANKTILTVGDAIFAAKMNFDPPTLWTTFDNQVPKSLFFSTDPVAIDCVMCDFLDAEKAIPDYSDGYLSLASHAGLGVYERGDPWGSGYNLIDYVKVDP